MREAAVPPFCHSRREYLCARFKWRHCPQFFMCFPGGCAQQSLVRGVSIATWQAPSLVIVFAVALQQQYLALATVWAAVRARYQCGPVL